MALQGTLDTFALPDVLRLLASTKKVGRLRVTGDGGSGSLWVDGGTVVGSELLVRGAEADSLTEVLFNLLRFANGSFTFEAGATPPSTGVERDVESIIVEAELMLGEWRALELVVPSLDAWLSLTEELKGRDVVVDAARWRIIVSIGSGATVGDVGRRFGLGDLAVMRAVKEVIELGLVDVRDAGAPPVLEVPSVVDVQVVATVDPEVEPAPFEEHHAEHRDVEHRAVDDADVDAFDAPDVYEAVGTAEGPSGAPEHRESPSFVIEPLGVDLDESADIASFAAVDEPVTDPAVDVPVFANDTPIAPQSLTEVRTGLGAMQLSHEPARAPRPEARPEPRREPSWPAIGQDTPLDEPSQIARQLASLSPRAAKAVAAAAKATTEEERDAALATIEAEDETINRGLLLKFLGAVDR